MISTFITKNDFKNIKVATCRCDRAINEVRLFVFALYICTRRGELVVLYDQHVFINHSARKVSVYWTRYKTDTQGKGALD